MAWAPDYITTEDLREYIVVNDLDDDTQIGWAITAASRAIDDHTNRQFGQVDQAEERRYTAWPDGCRWVVTIDDLQTTDGLIVEVDGTPVTAYELEAVNAVAKGKAWTRLAFVDDSEATPTGVRHEVAVTARWGWAEVPVPVQQATILQASRLLKRRHAPFGIAGSPDTGSEMRLLAKVDPDVAVSLRGYGRARAVG